MAFNKLALKLETYDMLKMKEASAFQNRSDEEQLFLFCATSYELVALTAQDIAALGIPLCFEQHRTDPLVTL